MQSPSLLSNVSDPWWDGADDETVLEALHGENALRICSSYGIYGMEEFTKTVTLENENEARLLDSILTERDIPHLMRSYHDTAFDGLFQTQKGWGYISSPEGYREEILEIVADLRKGI